MLILKNVYLNEHLENICFDFKNGSYTVPPNLYDLIKNNNVDKGYIKSDSPIYEINDIIDEKYEIVSDYINNDLDLLDNIISRNDKIKDLDVKYRKLLNLFKILSNNDIRIILYDGYLNNYLYAKINKYLNNKIFITTNILNYTKTIYITNNKIDFISYGSFKDYVKYLIKYKNKLILSMLFILILSLLIPFFSYNKVYSDYLTIKNNKLNVYASGIKELDLINIIDSEEYVVDEYINFDLNKNYEKFNFDFLAKADLLNYGMVISDKYLEDLIERNEIEGIGSDITSYEEVIGKKVKYNNYNNDNSQTILGVYKEINPNEVGYYLTKNTHRESDYVFELESNGSIAYSDEFGNATYSKTYYMNEIFDSITANLIDLPDDGIIISESAIKDFIGIDISIDDMIIENADGSYLIMWPADLPFVNINISYEGNVILENMRIYGFFEYNPYYGTVVNSDNLRKLEKGANKKHTYTLAYDTSNLYELLKVLDEDGYYFAGNSSDRYYMNLPMITDSINSLYTVLVIIGLLLIIFSIINRKNIVNNLKKGLGRKRFLLENIKYSAIISLILMLIIGIISYLTNLLTNYLYSINKVIKEVLISFDILDVLMIFIISFLYLIVFNIFSENRFNDEIKS